MEKQKQSVSDSNSNANINANAKTETVSNSSLSPAQSDARAVITDSGKIRNSANTSGGMSGDMDANMPDHLSGDMTGSNMPGDLSGDSARAMKCRGVNLGSLPGECAPMAFPYVPAQTPNPVRYSRMEALETGTLFPGLNLPFKAAIQSRTKLTNTALVELMALDFAIQELGLFLTTHPDDQEALQLYWSYLQLAKEGRERYQRKYGPLLQSDPTPEAGYAWLRDPWPWDPAGNP